MVETFFQQILNGLKDLGPLGLAVFIPIYILGSLLFVPNPFLTLAAGALFGVPVGFGIVSISSVISAGGVFLTGRYFSRGWLYKKIEANQKIKAVDDAVSKEGWKMVALLRFTAVLPFTVMNYGLGLSKIRFKHYILATWVSMMPGILLYVYLGSLAAGMILGTGERQKTQAEWIFFVIGIVITFGVGFYATRVVRKAIQSPKA